MHADGGSYSSDATQYFYGASEHGSFYAIDLYTLFFELYLSAENESSDVSSIFFENVERREQAIMSIHNWCLSEPSRWIKIEESRSRASSPLTRSFFSLVSIPYHDRGSCRMRTALSNSFHITGTQISPKFSRNLRRGQIKKISNNMDTIQGFWTSKGTQII